MRDYESVVKSALSDDPLVLTNQVRPKLPGEADASDSGAGLNRKLFRFVFRFERT